MTTADLHKILDDQNRKLSLAELKQVIYDEMIECARQSTCVECNGVSINKVAVSNEINPYWKGKEHAFQIVLDLLEHCNHLIELPCKRGDPIWVVYRGCDEYGIRKYKIFEAVCCGFDLSTPCTRIITNFSCYESDRIGNFTNKEQAEQRLKELQDDDN